MYSSLLDRRGLFIFCVVVVVVCAIASCGDPEPAATEGCDTAEDCPGEQICEDDVCVDGVDDPDGCAVGETMCDGDCVDTETHQDHCGSCGISCGDNETCSSSSCVCDANSVECGGVCVDTSSNDHHCGQCGNSCGDRETCDGSQCVCADDYLDCGEEECVDPSANANHCGSCGNACDDTDVCAGGVCADDCPGGQTGCDRACFDLDTSNRHCGSCGNECTTDIDGATALCDGSGKCTEQCSFAGHDMCEDLGLCADLDNDDNHCGSCGNECTTDIDGAVSECDGSGTCDVSCVLTAHTYCESQEVCADLQDDDNHCGQCGSSCPDGQSCIDGFCEPVVEPGDPGDCDPDGTPFGGGEGNAVSPYKICSNLQLNRIDDSDDHLDAHYQLYVDLNLDDVADFPVLGQGSYDWGDHEWDEAFSGVFDGDGHAIHNLTITAASDDHVGMFGALDNGTIRDLSLIGVDITGSENVGGLVGRNDGVIENVSVDGQVTGDEQVGGITGYNFWDGGVIRESHSSGSVTANDRRAGGLVGYNVSEITDSTSSADVATTDAAGGVVGTTGGGSSCRIERSGASGDVSQIGGGGEGFGGFAGRSGGLDECHIIESRATGDVYAPDSNGVAGFYARAFAEGEIRDCYATGDVTGSFNTGGFIGVSSDNNYIPVHDSYAYGESSGNGFIGSPGSSSAFFNSYWNEDVNTGDSQTTALTEVEFEEESNFEDWDFDDVWTMSDTEDRPILQWEE